MLLFDPPADGAFGSIIGAVQGLTAPTPPGAVMDGA